MGYEIPDKTLRIKFDGTDYDGAEIVMRLNVALGRVFEILSHAEKGEIQEALHILGDAVLIEWNLEEEGKPISTDAKGMLQIPLDMATIILNQWSGVVANPPSPLSPQSGNGSTLETPLAETGSPLGSQGSYSAPV